MELGSWQAVDTENRPQQILLSRTGSGFYAGQQKQELGGLSLWPLPSARDCVMMKGRRPALSRCLVGVMDEVQGRPRRVRRGVRRVRSEPARLPFPGDDSSRRPWRTSQTRSASTWRRSMTASGKRTFARSRSRSRRAQAARREPQDAIRALEKAGSGWNAGKHVVIIPTVRNHDSPTSSSSQCDHDGQHRPGCRTDKRRFRKLL